MTGAKVNAQAYLGGRDERLTLLQTLHTYSAGGAWAAHREHVTGALRAGMTADLVMMGCDVGATPPEDLDRSPVALTVAGGRITHRLSV